MIHYSFLPAFCWQDRLFVSCDFFFLFFFCFVFAKAITAKSFSDYFLDVRTKTPISGSYPMQSPLPSMAPGILQFPVGTPPPGFTVPAMVY